MTRPIPDTRVHAAAAAQDAPAGVVVCRPGETPDAAVERLYGSAPPPPVVIVLPSNGREPQPTPPAASGQMETER